MSKSQSIANSPAPAAPPLSTSLPTQSLVRHWTIPVIGVTLVLVIGLLVLEVVLLKNKTRPIESASPKADDPPQPGETPPAVPPVKPPDKKVPDEIAVRRAAAAKGEFPRVQAALVQPVVKVEAPSGPVLDLIGGLATVHLFQTYYNLGLIADAVANGLYTREQGRELLEDINRMTETVERQLAQLPAEELQEEATKRRLEKVQAIQSQFRSAVKELKAFWDTSDPEYAKKFEKIRKDVYAELGKLSGAK